ncbi:MAG: oligosaccharide flippase family protein [Lachnospiraceae bacterium]|nr:oligosaccharide flippase family protein [Lachnospiraceae bacterium]
MSLKSLTNFKNMPLEAKASVAYAVCSILQNCIAFIALPIFARILTTEQYGDYTLYTTWAAIFVIFITLNLPYGSFSTAMVKYEDQRNEYIASAEGVCLVCASIFLLIYSSFSRLWKGNLDFPIAVIIIMTLEKLGNAGILFWSGKKRFEFKYKEVIVVTLLESFLAPVLALVLVLNFDEKGYAMIMGYASVTIVIGGYIFIYNLIKGKKIFVKEFWQYALGFNLPLIFYYLSQVIFNQSDRIMIKHYESKSEAAIYGVAYSLAIVLIFVINAINNSYVPWLYGKIKEKKQKENQSIACMLSILIAFLLSGVIWLAPEIIRVMAGKKYMSAIWVVPPVAMSVLLLFYSQFFINIEFYFERKKDLVFASVASAVINIVLNAIFIPEFGFVVAGYTTLFSYIVFVIANYIAMKKVLKEENLENNIYNYKLLVLIFIVFFVLSMLAAILYKYLLIRYAIIAVVLVALIIKRKVVIKYINIIRNM